MSEREALVRVCQCMIDIVERVGCKDWRDEHGRRLKDAKQWVEFYVAVNRAAERAALTAPQQEPVAWLVQYRDRHEFTFKKPAFLIDAIAEPLYGPDLLAYADRMESAYKMAHQQAMENGEKRLVAERQLAELKAKHDALVKRLREPTQEMQTAGVDATEFTFSCKRQVRDAFRAMSAVALREGDE